VFLFVTDSRKMDYSVVT